uniref:Uncharacterized protein n=1 Tax=Pipistrellus kuhlii TaxID=59472 RepID=A0A7J7UTX4_PIPKU|nr:hypothetical protein mPipKuh1_008735 [Pipistrellus kuhlii]
MCFDFRERKVEGKKDRNISPGQCCLVSAAQPMIPRFRVQFQLRAHINTWIAGFLLQLGPCGNKLMWFFHIAVFSPSSLPTPTLALSKINGKKGLTKKSNICGSGHLLPALYWGSSRKQLSHTGWAESIFQLGIF